MSKKNLIKSNLKFNRLTVIKEVERYKIPNKNIFFRQALFRCDCGKEKIMIYSQVKSGYCKSCGCYGIEARRKSRKIHGKSNKHIYFIWQGMKQRCLNENAKDYKNYGGRGITVCSEWLNSFENFYKDMCDKYKEGLTIERINNDGNYNKENCIWVKQSEQQKNTRKNVFITYHNKTMIVSDWERHLGFSKDYIGSYIRKGLTLKQIINRKKYERLKISKNR